MTAKDKAALMRKMRARREREGWVQINLWVKPEWVAKVRAYVARLTRASDNQGTVQK